MPTDSCQLSAMEVFSEADSKVWMFAISAKPNACISVDGEGFHSHIVLPDSKEMVPQHGEVFISATRIVPSQSSSAYIRTLICPMTREGKAPVAEVHTLPTNTALTAFFCISASDGIYRLNSPITIGQMQGKPITLVVGKPTKMPPNNSLQPTATAPFDLHKP